MGGWVGGLSSIEGLLDFWNLFNFEEPPCGESWLRAALYIVVHV